MLSQRTPLLRIRSVSIAASTSLTPWWSCSSAACSAVIAILVRSLPDLQEVMRPPCSARTSRSVRARTLVFFSWCEAACGTTRSTWCISCPNSARYRCSGSGALPHEALLCGADCGEAAERRCEEAGGVDGAAWRAVVRCMRRKSSWYVRRMTSACSLILSCSSVSPTALATLCCRLMPCEISATTHRTLCPPRSCAGSHSHRVAERKSSTTSRSSAGDLEMTTRGAGSLPASHELSEWPPAAAPLEPSQVLHDSRGSPPSDSAGLGCSAPSAA
mmetsp:Transcript_7427/g.16374  ORF Transcript_7427/g.16374 Transcript_7427/m.16374 type:complete len:274 (-) Transcript_7427:101-922(-)